MNRAPGITGWTASYGPRNSPEQETNVPTWHERERADLTRGERAADRLRNWMGSWWFVGGFLLFMVAWALLNAFETAWDPYPYILLNLFLSMLAGLQGAILLIAAKRQDAIAAALAEHDYETDATAKREIEELTAINNTQLTELRELRRALELLGAPAAQTTTHRETKEYSHG